MGLWGRGGVSAMAGVGHGQILVYPVVSWIFDLSWKLIV